MTITFTGNIPSKKNSKQLFRNSRTGKSFVTTSDNYKAWHGEWSYKLRSMKPVTPFLKVHIDYKFYKVDNRKFDLSNKIESIQDLLVDCGILEDDNYTVISSFNTVFLEEPLLDEKGLKIFCEINIKI